MSSFRFSLSSTETLDMSASNLLTTTTTGCILLNIPLFLVRYGSESWHLPVNLSAQIAPDYISEYLTFLTFSGGMSPDPHSMLGLGLSIWALKRPYCISHQYAPPRLTNKKCLGTPMVGQQCCASFAQGLYNIPQCWEFLANHVASVCTGLWCK